MSDHPREFIPTAEVKARYGGRSDMWIERRLKDPDSTFPKPYRFEDGRYRYWKLSELEAWERSCAAASSKTAAA
jgi:predicted DNA-binding transcriptional regulator AlpA